MIGKSGLVVLGLLCSGVAGAQALLGVTATPSDARVGEPVLIAVQGVTADNPFCGFRLNYGDGVGEDIKVKNALAFPLTRQHTFANAGAYRITVEGKKVTTHLSCVGGLKEVVLQVRDVPVREIAPASKPVAVTKVVAPARQCPAGWKLSGPSAASKRGGFVCTAKPNAKPPAARVSCGKKLEYFENLSAGKLGCR